MRQTKTAALAALVAFLALAATGCLKVTPYQRPSAAVPQSFKEPPPEGWKQAQPSDETLRGKWWEIFGDPALNALEEQVSISNQNVLQAEANFREAQAAVRVARSALYPTVNGSASATGSQASSRLGNPIAPSPTGTYDVPVSASYTYDVWGTIHRSVTASANTAQSVAALIESARLLYQAELAEDYFQLHGSDADAALFQQADESYKEYLQLTRDRYAGGVATDGDVAQAETQLYTTQAQLADLGVERSQLEHAMAILIGKPPAELSVPSAPVPFGFPRIPVSLPSALLERRPDIADIERQAAAAYRQTVLTAFQQVEDNLAALRVLENEASVLEQAVASAQRALTVSTAQYKGGTGSYLQVITTQTIALQDQRSAIDVQTRRMTAAVLLIEALGGGWDASQLPTVQSLARK